MQQPLKNQPPQPLEGLDNLFVSESQTDITVLEPTDLVEASVPEAAKLLGITERSIWRRIRLGKLQSKLVNGKTFVSVYQSDVRPTRQSDNKQTSVVVSVNQHDMPIDSISYVQQLLDLLKEKDKQLQAAGYRNGYLEAQLQEREKEVKLLTDSQHKGKWWQRVGKWFVRNAKAG